MGVYLCFGFPTVYVEPKRLKRLDVFFGTVCSRFVLSHAEEDIPLLLRKLGYDFICFFSRSNKLLTYIPCGFDTGDAKPPIGRLY